MGCVKENKTVKDILGYEIGEEVWFIASMAETMDLNLEYADRLVEGNNTTYRFISIPTKGLIRSIYITKRSKASDNDDKSSFALINVGGTRFRTNDVEEILKYYNPKTDLINFEISTEFSPGAIDRRYPAMSFGQYDVRSNFSPFPEILVSMCKPFFASGIVTVYSDFVGSTPEEAESNYIDIQQKMTKVYKIIQHTSFGASSVHFNGYSVRV